MTPSNGEVWITCEFSNQIDEFLPNSKTFLSFNLPTPFSSPDQIVFDSKGNFWFAAPDADMIGYGTVSQLRNGTTDGIREFAPNDPTYTTTIIDSQQPSGKLISSLSSPSQIALSPNGSSLWISEHAVSSFDQYNIQTGALSKYWTSQTQNSEYSTSLPNGIAVDAGGHVWIVEHYGNMIAEFDPATENLVEYPIPCCVNEIAGTLYLALGKNGTVWFTEFSGNSIGELFPTATPANQTISLSIPNSIASIPENGKATFPVYVSFNSGSNASSSATFAISGISATGQVENSTASSIRRQRRSDQTRLSPRI